MTIADNSARKTPEMVNACVFMFKLYVNIRQNLPKSVVRNTRNSLKLNQINTKKLWECFILFLAKIHSTTSISTHIDIQRIWYESEWGLAIQSDGNTNTVSLLFDCLSFRSIYSGYLSLSLIRSLVRSLLLSISLNFSALHLILSLLMWLYLAHREWLLRDMKTAHIRILNGIM